MRKILALTAVLATLTAGVGAAAAQTPAQKALVDAAKAEGIVGEQADGYLGFRSNSSDAALRTAVTVTNDGRRTVYQRSATSAGDGATTEIAGQRMFETQLFARIPSGQWYRNADGQWVQR
jgi:Uncharacterized protein conserved in bacteria